MWFGIVLSEEEITEKYNKIISKFSDDNRNKIPRIELTQSISEEFNIPLEVAESYVTISLTYYSQDWYNMLDNVIRLMRTKMCHSVFETLKACGKESNIENAKNEILKIKNK